MEHRRSLCPGLGRDAWPGLGPAASRGCAGGGAALGADFAGAIALDNRPLGPDDYAALEAALAQFPEDAVAVHPELQSLLFQLKLLKLLKDIVPFF
ncbi:MAG: hypothetical protein HC824_08745 [Synechococcales cyanobacterium RM1_1_8]|nr:hypothetical protein [Synechococcales cyanobacterium RM1_1_8]